MKTILALGAAALLLSAGAAQARRIAEISLDGYCNIYHVVQTGGIASVQDTPSCSGTYGGGVVGSVSGEGKSMVLAIQDASSPGVQNMLALSYPFETGGTFTLYETTDGTNFHVALTGSYSLAGRDRGPKGPRSVTAPR